MMGWLPLLALTFSGVLLDSVSGSCSDMEACLETMVAFNETSGIPVLNVVSDQFPTAEARLETFCYQFTTTKLCLEAEALTCSRPGVHTVTRLIKRIGQNICHCDNRADMLEVFASPCFTAAASQVQLVRSVGNCANIVQNRARSMGWEHERPDFRLLCPLLGELRQCMVSRADTMCNQQSGELAGYVFDEIFPSIIRQTPLRVCLDNDENDDTERRSLDDRLGGFMTSFLAKENSNGGLQRGARSLKEILSPWTG